MTGEKHRNGECRKTACMEDDITANEPASIQFELTSGSGWSCDPDLDARHLEGRSDMNAAGR